uniref:DUF5641 domain-containing protein n=1 Tax=Steinernema glaseri TaxID=37863 RepID=A0A1I7YC08_9BILA
WLTVEEYQTLIAEVEANVNSRPLTYLQGSVSDQVVLRPIDFISPGARVGVPTHRQAVDERDPDYLPPGTESDEQLLQMFDQTLTRLDKAWNYFQEHYLKSLRQRAQLIHRGLNPQRHAIPRPGDVVIVHEDNLARGEWKV